MENKQMCKVCKETLPYSSYTKNKKGRNGIHTTCRECKKKYLKKYYQKNKDKVKEQYLYKKCYN